MEKKQVKNLGQYLLFVVMCLFALLMVFPLIWLLSASFQGPGEIFQIPFRWIPKKIMFSNYTVAWTAGGFQSAMISSFCVSGIYLAVHIFACTITGYVLAKFKFRFNNLFFLLILGTMMIPQELTLLPIYDIIKDLHLVNSYLGVALPLFISATGIFMMRQFSTAIPDELIESARIDGCNNTRIFFSIVFPLLKSGVVALGVLAYAYIWNEFTWSRIVLSSDRKLTLPLALTSMIRGTQLGGNLSITNALAASVIAMLPVVVIFLLFQRNFIESIASTGLKG